MVAAFLVLVVLWLLWVFIGWWALAVIAGFIALVVVLVYLSSKYPDWFPTRPRRQRGGLRLEITGTITPRRPQHK